jgi:CDP-diacylglycerol--glycerol-3-phosphate 3-phosphatidyltransferase
MNTTEKTQRNSGDFFQHWRLQTRKQTASLTNLIRIIPVWVPANLITLLRAFLLLPIYLAYANQAWGLMIGLYLVAWFTDILDGLHARYRGQISTFGKLLDPAVDKIFVVGLLLIAAPGRLSVYVIWTTITLEIVIVLMAILLGPFSRFFKIKLEAGANTWGKLKMFLQGLALTALLMGLNSGWLQVIAEVMFWCAVILAVLSIVIYLRSTLKASQ